MNGTRISSTFDGRWVNTIVRMSPNRAASGPAASAETRGQDVGGEQDAAQQPPGRHRSWLVNQNGDEPEHDEPAAEGIEREQGTARRHDDAARLVEAERDRCGRAARRVGRRSTSTAAREQREQHAIASPIDGIAHDHDPVGVGRRGAGPERGLGDDAGRQRARSAVGDRARRAGSGRTGRVRPRGSTSCVSDACSTARNGPTSLPLGLMTPSVAATSSTGNTVEVANTRPAPSISSGADEQRAASAEAVGASRQEQRDRGVAEQGEGEQQADLVPVEADGLEVQDEDDGQEPVREHAQVRGR